MKKFLCIFAKVVCPPVEAFSQKETGNIYCLTVSQPFSEFQTRPSKTKLAVIINIIALIMREIFSHLSMQYAMHYCTSPSIIDVESIN